MVEQVLLDNDDEFSYICQEHSIKFYITDTLTCKNRGFTYYDGEEFHIIISTRFSSMQQKKTTIHELIHILQNHFACAECNRQQCEDEVHDIIKDFRKYYSEEYALDLY